MPDEDVEVTLELRTHSGISQEDMLDAVGRYLDKGAGFVYVDSVDCQGWLTHAMGIITRADLEGGELTASVRLLSGADEFFPGPRAARSVRAMVEAKDKGAPQPYLSPVGIGWEGCIEHVSSVVVKVGDPAVPAVADPAPVKGTSSDMSDPNRLMGQVEDLGIAVEEMFELARNGVMREITIFPDALSGMVQFRAKDDRGETHFVAFNGDPKDFLPYLVCAIRGEIPSDRERGDG